MLSFACQDIEFKDLLQCSFQLNKTEYNVMMYLLVSGKVFTAKELAKNMNLDRTSVQKALKVLAEKDLVLRYQENLKKGGYIFYYRIKNKEEIKERMRNIVDKWHTAVIEEIKKW